MRLGNCLFKYIHIDLQNMCILVLCLFGDIPPCNISGYTYEDVYRLVTVHTHGDLIVLYHLGDQAMSAMTQYPTESHYPDTEQTDLFFYPVNGEHQARLPQFSVLVSH